MILKTGFKVCVINIVLDLNFFFKDYNLDGCGNCKVHKGFHNVYENLVNNLLGCAYTLTTNHPTAKIVVTGNEIN